MRKSSPLIHCPHGFEVWKTCQLNDNSVVPLIIPIIGLENHQQTLTSNNAPPPSYPTFIDRLSTR